MKALLTLLLTMLTPAAQAMFGTKTLALLKTATSHKSTSKLIRKSQLQSQKRYVSQETQLFTKLSDEIDKLAKTNKTLVSADNKEIKELENLIAQIMKLKKEEKAPSLLAVANKSTVEEEVNIAGHTIRVFNLNKNNPSETAEKVVNYMHEQIYGKK